MKQNEERFSEEEIKKLEDLLLGSTDLDFLWNTTNMTIHTKITRDSRLNPTAVTDEFKKIVTDTCDLLGVREPDLVRSAVEKYVRELYAQGEVIEFESNNFHKDNIGPQYIVGTIYTAYDTPHNFTLEVMKDQNGVMGMNVTFLTSNAELERFEQRIIKKFSTLNRLRW